MSACPSDHNGCARCERLPSTPAPAGTLYLAAPLGHTEGKVLQALDAAGIVWQRQGRVLEIACLGNGAAVAAAVRAALSDSEVADTRALFMPTGQVPGIGDLVSAMSLRAWFGLQRGSWLLDMIREQRLSVHFQPIVPSTDTGRIFAYECLLRGTEAGRTVFPGEIFQVGTDADLLFQLDLAARRTAIREAAAQRLESRVFINFTPSSIYDPTFCLRSTVQAIKASGLRNEQIVFEVTESAYVGDTRHLRAILDYYRAHGFGVALDDIGSGYSSLNLLHQLRPDFLKLDMELIRGVDQDPYKAIITRKLLEAAQGLGIRTVAEGVETAGELAWARDNGADLVQGYYICRPASPPPLPAQR